MGSLLLISLWMSNMIIVCTVAIVATVGLLTWQIIRFVKTTDPTIKRPIMRNMALVLLIPAAAFVAVYIYLAIGLIIAFS